MRIMKIIELRENAVRQNSASVISLLQSISLYHGKTYDLPKIKGLNRLPQSFETEKLHGIQCH
jgi:hypothetical protein